MKIYIEHKEDKDMDQVFENENDFINEVNKTMGDIISEVKYSDVQKYGHELSEEEYPQKASNLTEAIEQYKEFGYRIYILAEV